MIIRYVDLERGKTSAILDLHKVPDVISKAVSGILKECIAKGGLSAKQFDLYDADSCSVNYGNIKSIFVKLKNS